jgi:glycosyltransferase involved in cell wall biosynthesis
LADPELRRRLGLAGRDRARTLFSWEHVTDATLAAYAEALGTMER